MLPDPEELKPYYRMPRVFGALPGPRNIPRDKQHLANNQRNIIMSVSARTDHDALSALLPPNCELDGPPILTLSLNRMENIAWLAGRGYSMLIASFRIASRNANGDRVPGTFIPVLWENIAEPITTGREELGFAKLFADLPRPTIVGNRWHARGLWDGFGFCEIKLDELTDAPIPQSPPVGNYHYKYFPKNSALHKADVDYLVYAPPGVSQAGYNIPKIARYQAAKGTFAFNPTTWEDMPFQYPIINALAALPLLEFTSASLAFATATGAVGDPGPGTLLECLGDWPSV